MNNILKWLKKSWGALVVFILGFFLIKRGIDKKVLTDLAVEKAKEDTIKLDELQKQEAAEEKVEVEIAKERDNLEKEVQEKQEQIDLEAETKKEELKKEAKENPDEFAKKFSKRFKIRYDRGK